MFSRFGIPGFTVPFTRFLEFTHHTLTILGARFLTMAHPQQPSVFKTDRQLFYIRKGGYLIYQLTNEICAECDAATAISSHVSVFASINIPNRQTLMLITIPTLSLYTTLWHGLFKAKYVVPMRKLLVSVQQESICECFKASRINNSEEETKFISPNFWGLQELGRKSLGE